MSSGKPDTFPFPGMPGAIEVLLVEDNPYDAEMTIRALRQNHFANRLVLVQDGAEALNLLFGDPDDPGAAPPVFPRLVLLDLHLPKVDGHEVLSRLKSDPRTRGIPVVVLTSSREEADLERAWQNGTNSFIVKPVEFDDFAEAVHQLGLYWLLLNELPPPSHD